MRSIGRCVLTTRTYVAFRQYNVSIAPRPTFCDKPPRQRNNGNKRRVLRLQSQWLIGFDLAAHPCTAEMLIKQAISYILFFTGLLTYHGL